MCWSSPFVAQMRNAIDRATSEAIAQAMDELRW
jgi:hypothetical protein